MTRSLLLNPFLLPQHPTLSKYNHEWLSATHLIRLPNISSTKGILVKSSLIAETPAALKTIGYAATSATAQLTSFSFQRREPLPRDVQIEILYCGVCHSDLHTARNEWQNTIYPCVPGHAIVGRVTA